MRLRFRFAAIAAGILLLASCVSAPTHNDKGGYIPACGELPPLVGDDC
jgi:hypothetical protein